MERRTTPIERQLAVQLARQTVLMEIADKVIHRLMNKLTALSAEKTQTAHDHAVELNHARAKKITDAQKAYAREVLKRSVADAIGEVRGRMEGAVEMSVEDFSKVFDFQ